MAWGHAAPGPHTWCGRIVRARNAFPPRARPPQAWGNATPVDQMVPLRSDGLVHTLREIVCQIDHLCEIGLEQPVPAVEQMKLRIRRKHVGGTRGGATR